MHVSVRVVVKAKREKVERVSTARLKISVKEPAERNEANKRVRQLVAAHFGVHERQVRLISGHTSPSKVFTVAATAAS